MLTFKEVEENNLISKDILDTIPRTCRCGAELQFTESLSELKCTNEHCEYTVIKRLDNMIRKLGLTGWSLLDIEDLVRDNNFETPFQLMLIDQLTGTGKDSNITNFSDKVSEINNIKNSEVELWRVVYFADIKYLSSIAYELFGSYDSMGSTYNDIEYGQIAYISEKLGIKDDEPSVLAILIYDELLRHKEELLFAETQFKIRKHKTNPVRIAISGSVNDFINKTSFIEYLNLRYNNHVEFVLDSSITDETVALISDDGRTSNKIRFAQKINDEYISEGIKNNLFKLDSIGVYLNETDVRAIGQKVAICTSNFMISKYDKAFEIK